METQQISVSAVVFRDDLYPRIDTSPQTVQKYAEDLSVLPPIEVNQHNILIDGWHRWTAHRKQRAETVPCIITKTETEAQLYQLAVERNATHGVQLANKDKSRYARQRIEGISLSDMPAVLEEIAKIVSVPVGTVRNWTQERREELKKDRDGQIADLWLACHAQREIAEQMELDQSVISEMNLMDFTKFRKIHQIEEAQHNYDTDPDFKPPIYNVWTKGKASNDVRHPGQSEASFLDNLLYAYTEPLDTVFDPFGGGGSTIDICKKRLRRYYVSDLTPIPEREDEIRQHDITQGLPKIPRWEGVKLVYLDPPYWKQMEGQYSDKAEDLANMPFELFQQTLADVIKGVAEKLQSGAHIALIIQPTQWNTDAAHTFTDHVADLFRRVSLPIVQRIQAPYSTQQCKPQMVDWAKENRQFLVLSREIVVWRVE